MSTPKPLSEVIKDLRTARTSKEIFFTAEEYHVREVVADELEQWAEAWDLALPDHEGALATNDYIRERILGLPAKEEK